MSKIANSLEIKLDWSEMDLLGHVNNVHYFKFVQASRISFMSSLGMPTDDPALELGPILAKTSCDFLKPLHFPDTIQVDLRIKKLGISSLVLSHDIKNGKGEICAKAEDVIVLFNYKKNEKESFSEDLRARLEDYLK